MWICAALWRVAAFSDRANVAGDVRFGMSDDSVASDSAVECLAVLETVSSELALPCSAAFIGVTCRIAMSVSSGHRALPRAPPCASLHLGIEVRVSLRRGYRLSGERCGVGNVRQLKRTVAGRTRPLDIAAESGRATLRSVRHR